MDQLMKALEDYTTINVLDELSNIQDGLTALDMMTETSEQDYEQAQQAFQYVVRHLQEDLNKVQISLKNCTISKKAV